MTLVAASDRAARLMTRSRVPNLWWYQHRSGEALVEGGVGEQGRVKSERRLECDEDERVQISLSTSFSSLDTSARSCLSLSVAGAIELPAGS